MGGEWMKKEWIKPKIEVLDIGMTMKFHPPKKPKDPKDPVDPGDGLGES